MLCSLVLILSVTYLGQENIDHEGGAQKKISSSIKTSILNFEKRFLGRIVLFQGTRQSHEIESNADGSIIRLVKEVPLPNQGYIVHSGNYASLQLGQMITVMRYDPPKPNVEPTMPSFSYIKTKSDLASKFDSTMYGICYGQRFSDYFDTATISKTEIANGKTSLTCSRTDTGTWVQFTVNSDGLLESVRWEAQPGMKLADGQVCPPGQWYKQRTDYEYNSEVPAKLIKLKLTDLGSGGVNAATSYSITEKGELEKELSLLIDLPGYGLKNGTRVGLLEQPRNPFQFMDGRVVAVVDSESVKAAKSARWRQAALNSRYYYIGLCAGLCGVISFLVWRRNRK